MPKSDERTALYRLYDEASALLYVGIAQDPAARLRQHRLDQAWGSEIASNEVKWFDTRPLAAAAESFAIRTEQPRHNGHSRPERSRRYRQIADELRAEIMAGKLSAGALLPSEHSLAALYATTRATVRKGIALLRAEGLVVSHQGQGAFVADPVTRSVPVSVTDPLLAAATLTEHMTREALAALTRALVAQLAE
ncbi:GntR family transcriptional regulator [Streptomyces sp. S186]|uniref:GntR family transcriptional regulator n=1 Tax=Streptomyces sp. S186 TaxID=3434395 RepID=UPI003F67B7D4